MRERKRERHPSLPTNGRFYVVWDNYHYREKTSIQQATFKLASRLSLPSAGCLIARRGLYSRTQWGSCSHTRTNTHSCTHTLIPSPSFFSIVKWICVMERCVTGDVSCLTAQETQTWPRQLETSFGPTRLSWSKVTVCPCKIPREKCSEAV